MTAKISPADFSDRYVICLVAEAAAQRSIGFQACIHRAHATRPDRQDALCYATVGREQGSIGIRPVGRVGAAVITGWKPTLQSTPTVLEV
jgi:hypothetical protein